MSDIEQHCVSLIIKRIVGCDDDKAIEAAAMIDRYYTAPGATTKSDGGESVASGNIIFLPKDFARVYSAINAAKDVLRGYSKIDYDAGNNPQPNAAFDVEQQCKEAMYILDECSRGFPPSQTSPSDPSSTRNDVTVEAKHLVSSARAFLAHFDPCDLAEDKSQQWQSLEHQCNRVERALLDNPQFEIRR